MEPLAPKILNHAKALPEGTPVYAKELLHLGERSAVDQALCRLASTGALMRVGRGLYALPVQGKFGTRAPAVPKLMEGLANLQGETIVPSGAASANSLGLTTQVPIKSVYLTSGRTRKLQLGKQEVELRHAPPWQLVLPGRIAGEVVRALAWMGPSECPEALRTLSTRLPAAQLQEAASARGRLPTWLAKGLSSWAVSHA